MAKRRTKAGAQQVLEEAPLMPTGALAVALLGFAETAHPVVHVARDDARAMFAGELAALAEAHAGSVELLPVRTAVHGWPTEQSLRRLLGDRLRGGPVLVAGPEGLVRVVEAAADGPVLSEVFHDGHPD